MTRIFLICVVSLSGMAVVLAQAQSISSAPNPVVMANQKLAVADRQQMMKLLGISEPANLPPPAQDPNRPPYLTQKAGNTKYWFDAAGNSYIRSLWGSWQNYDETKANPWPLPDPLTLKSGRPVENADTWWKQRRPEILNDFLTEVYGRIPEHTPRVTWEAVPVVNAALAGTARIVSVVGHVDNSAYPAASPRIEMTLYLPVKASKPVPVMVLVMGGDSNGHVKPPDVLAQILAKGWACATVATTPLQADSGAGLNLGIIGLVNQGQPRKPDQWGVLAAWSWGLSPVIDYLEMDKDVDSKHLGIEGHSRWGKTALLCAALDPRWAIVYASCSGQCGAKPSRRNWGETVDNICGVAEYHWMAGNFLKYAGHWNELPVDSPELISLVAPRPVFIGCGTTDQWADPHGQFLAAVAAGPVYRLLGGKDLGTKALPGPDAEWIAGDIGFRMHQGGHADALDWPTFLKFADKYFPAPVSAAR